MRNTNKIYYFPINFSLPLEKIYFPPRKYYIQSSKTYVQSLETNVYNHCTYMSGLKIENTSGRKEKSPSVKKIILQDF